MFPIYLKDDANAPLPGDDICYIIGKNGIFMKKKMGAVETLAKVDQISILEDIAPYAKFDIPSIPCELFANVVSFMKAVYKELRSESMVLIFFNPKTEHFVMYPPKQEVTGGGIKYERDYVLEGYNNIGTIHSHAGMSAFHSGVDVDDEKDTDGIHITIGKCGEDNYFDCTASLAFNGTRFPINIADYVTGLHYKEIVEEIPQTTRWSGHNWSGGHFYSSYGYEGIGRYANGVESYYSKQNQDKHTLTEREKFEAREKEKEAKQKEEEKKKEKKYRKIPGYVLDIAMNDLTHDTDWELMVSRPKPIAGGTIIYGGCGSSIFSSEYQEQLKKNQEKIDRTFMSPEVADLFDEPDFDLLPSSILNIGFNPCHECIFVGHKITMEEEGELDDDVPDFDGVDYNFINKEQAERLMDKGGDEK